MNGELKFTQSFDAVDWAKAFVEIAKKKGPDFATDEATMTGWFANAIMRGYDEHAERNKDALSLAAAVEGPEEATPETYSLRGWDDDGGDTFKLDPSGDMVRVEDCARMERQRNAALRALKDERERVAQFESERLPFPVLIRDTNFGKGVKVGTMLGCLKRHIEWNKPDIGPDAALAAQEGRT